MPSCVTADVGVQNYQQPILVPGVLQVSGELQHSSWHAGAPEPWSASTGPSAGEACRPWKSASDKAIPRRFIQMKMARMLSVAMCRCIRFLGVRSDRRVTDAVNACCAAGRHRRWVCAADGLGFGG